MYLGEIDENFPVQKPNIFADLPVVYVVSTNLWLARSNIIFANLVFLWHALHIAEINSDEIITRPLCQSLTNFRNIANNQAHNLVRQFMKEFFKFYDPLIFALE